MTTVGSLCFGYGGLELALQSVAADVELAWVADNHPDAKTLIEHHHPGVPNLDDLTTIDWANVEPVDILTAGYPLEWMMCLPEGHVTKIITKRTSALRMLGNGVVPPQAAYAIRTLLEGIAA